MKKLLEENKVIGTDAKCIDEILKNVRKNIVSNNSRINNLSEIDEIYDTRN
jgi:hypothetical protein